MGQNSYPAPGQHPSQHQSPFPGGSLPDQSGQIGDPQFPPTKERNVLGIVALVVAVVGFVFACIPGALIVGWVLLPIAFILGIVSVFLPRKGKGLGVAAIIVSVVGTVVGFIVFFAVVANSFSEAFGGDSEVVASEQVQEGESVLDEGAESDEEEAPVAEVGTRDNPAPLGSVIENNEWSVVLNSVDFDAADAIAAENMFNEPAPEGFAYIMVNVTVTYLGNDPDGAMPWVGIDYVTAEGNTIDQSESFVVAPDELDMFSQLYEGASATGNLVLIAPADSVEEGVFAVTPGMFGDKVFVSVQ